MAVYVCYPTKHILSAHCWNEVMLANCERVNVLKDFARLILASSHHRLASRGGANASVPCGYAAPSNPEARATAGASASAAAAGDPSSSSSSDREESSGTGPGSWGSESSTGDNSPLAYSAKRPWPSAAARGRVAAAHLHSSCSSSSSSRVRAGGAAALSSMPLGSQPADNRSFTPWYNAKESHHAVPNTEAQPQAGQGPANVLDLGMSGLSLGGPNQGVSVKPRR